MSRRTPPDPPWVDAILEWRWTWLLVRIALVVAYLVGGLTKLSDFPAAIAEQEHFGLHPGWLWATLVIVIGLGGSALVISGRFVWLGAGALSVLSAIATLVANDFWVMDGHARFVAMNSFLEHIGLIAGFVMVALIAAREARSRYPCHPKHFARSPHHAFDQGLRPDGDPSRQCNRHSRGQR